jgi:methyl-accepting chemotaxis protein
VANIKNVLRMLFRMPARSIGTRLFVLFVCIITVLVGGVGLVSYQIAGSSLVKQIETSSEQAISLTAEKLDMRLQYYLDVSRQLTNNSSFIQHLFQIGIPDLGDSERESRYNQIRDLLDQLALSDPLIRDITLIPLEDNISFISTKREGVNYHLAASWINEVRGAAGKAVWLPVASNGYIGSDSKQLFAYGQILGRSNIGSHDFLLLVQIEATLLQEMIAEVGLSQGAGTAIVDHEGDMITSNKSDHAWDSFEIPDTGEIEGSFHYADDRASILYAYRISPVSGWTVVGFAPLKELTGAVDQIRLLTIVSILICMLIAFIIGIWLVLMIGLPMSRMEVYMAQAASGDFRGRVTVKGKDEMANVAEAFNRMMEQIGKLVVETRLVVKEVGVTSLQMADAAAETAHSAGEIRVASEEIAYGATELASNADNSNRRVDLMGERLAKTLLLQNAMTASALEVNDVCRSARDTVDDLIGKSEESKQRFQIMSTRMHGLSKSTLSISIMLQVMTDLSKRIKILSLNASIEAARSGASGTGFMVIASEIRQLAEQSGSSIKEVGDMTESIHHGVSSAVSAMADALPIFSELLGEVQAVNQVFEKVQIQMEQLISGSADITTAIQYLHETQELLTASIQEVSSVSQQSSASSQQVASLCSAQAVIGDRLVVLSDSLKRTSNKLEDQMNHFQIESTS